jgi:hypothetical protein
MAVPEGLCGNRRYHLVFTADPEHCGMSGSRSQADDINVNTNRTRSFSTRYSVSESY